MSALSMGAASAALVWCLTAACRAETETETGTETSEALLAGLTLQQMPGANGGGMDVAWLQVTEGRVISVGANVSKIGQSQWAVFRGTAAQNRGSRPAVSGSVDIGPGSNDGQLFTYLKLGVGVSTSPFERWRVFARDTYVDIEPVSGHIVALGGETTRPNGLSLQLQTSRSASGTLDEQSHLVRIDYRARPPYLMGGVAMTTTNNRLALGVAPEQTASTKVQQAFFGMSFPVGGKELTLVAELGNIGGVRRSGLSLLLRSPLAPRN